MNTHFFNAKLLTYAGSDEVTDKGAVIVEGSSIAYAGPMDSPEYKKALTGKSFDRETDLKGNLIMPGIKNGHTHSGMTIFRSAADDLKLDDWLRNVIFPREAKFTPDDIYYATILAVMEYLTSGTTEVCEMYLTPDSIAKASKDTGFRMVQCGCVNDFSQSPEKILDWYERLNEPDSLNSFKIGIHAEYTCSEELLKEMSKIVNDLKAPLYIHVAETKYEVDTCYERRNGVSPVEYLDSLGLLNYGGLFFHGVHVTSEDMDIMKKRNIAVVTNPCSNLKLSSGIAPIQDYLNKGIRLAIGTDGAGSNNSLDMFKEMYLVSTLAKLKENDASVVDGSLVLKMACHDGALAMGTPETDSLAAGKKADLIVIDLHSPNMQPENNIVKNLVYSGSKSNVKLTMIDGVVRYEDGQFNIGFDPEKIYREVQKTVERVSNG